MNLFMMAVWASYRSMAGVVRQKEEARPLSGQGEAMDRGTKVAVS